MPHIHILFLTQNINQYINPAQINYDIHKNLPKCYTHPDQHLNF